LGIDIRDGKDKKLTGFAIACPEWVERGLEKWGVRVWGRFWTLTPSPSPQPLPGERDQVSIYCT